MERHESMAKLWNRKRVCGLAATCLLLGITSWYFIRTPIQSRAANPQTAGLAAVHASGMESMIDQLRQEADRQAEPLLARLRKSPDDPFLLAEIGKVYYQMRRYSVAAKYYGDSVRLRPDAAVFVKLGGAYHFDGDDEKAIGAWNHALRLDPNNPDALFNIGFVKWHVQGNPKGAIAAWQKLLKTNPNHPRRAHVEELLVQAKRHSEIPMARND
jgi:cytochrome c-type biogenesis protein CcmH/NrfG